jgi:CRISPR/Cas system CSM-associated protein Csm2 small subunit
MKMKLENTTWSLYRDSREVEKLIPTLEEALDNAYDSDNNVEDMNKAKQVLESAKALIEALRKAEEELEFLTGKGIVEG